MKACPRNSLTFAQMQTLRAEAMMGDACPPPPPSSPPLPFCDTSEPFKACLTALKVPAPFQVLCFDMAVDIMWDVARTNAQEQPELRKP